jgi:hypothetical protein
VFERPTGVMSTLDVDTDPTSVVVRCPVCSMTTFVDTATSRHNNGVNAVFVAGNASRLSYNELQSNHNDCWGHNSR